MTTIDLTGRNILITGACGAIAQYIVQRLSSAGATLLLTDVLDRAKAEDIFSGWKLASRVLYRTMDVTNHSQVESVVDQLSSETGGIETFLGHAGGCAMHPFAKTDPTEYDRIFQLNYFGQVNIARALLRCWTASRVAGHGIFTSSLVGSLPWINLSAYCPAKAALQMLARCLALEYAEHGIRFNVIAPGHVAAGSSLNVYETDPEYRRMVDKVIPLGRLVRPEAIADVLLWLCSPLADDVNGQVIGVDLGAAIPKVGG